MRALGRILVRIVFWSYERGTWPYDIAVAAIVLFVLLSPRGWFHDQPQVGPPPYDARVELLEADPSSPTRTYRVDARLLASPIRTPQLDRDLHDAVRKNVPELSGRAFQIVRIEPIHREDGTVIYYVVSIKP